MKFTSLDQIQDGVRVLAKFSTRDNADGSAPDYGEPKEVTLSVYRRLKAFKNQPAGYLLIVTPNDFAWAEHRQEDYDTRFNEFVTENYRMSILEVLS